MDKSLIWGVIPGILNKMPGPGALLVSSDGTAKKNVMTIGWIQFGLVWGEPVISVMVRPSRYTYKLLQTNGEFTVNVMPDDFNEALAICGSKSATYCDKFKEAELAVMNSEKISTPCLKDASIILECKTLYKYNMSARELNDLILARFYPEDDFHQILTASILNLKMK